MKVSTFLSTVVAAASLVSAQDALVDASIPPGVRLEPRLENQKILDGGRRSTINYGPYQIPPNGMVSKPTLRAQTPCTNCFITAIQANIIYSDGRTANVNTGAWLHHMVITKGMQPMFASGNERTPLRLNGKYKYGILLDAGASFMFISDLMSMSSQTQTVSMAITYEWIPRASATGYRDVYMKWNDVGQPAAREGVYSFKSTAASIPVTGRLLYTNGHVHDGGTHTILYVNNKEMCKSVMLYNRRPGFAEAGSEGSMGHDMGAMGHDMESMNTPAPTTFGSGGGSGLGGGLSGLGGGSSGLGGLSGLGGSSGLGGLSGLGGSSGLGGLSGGLSGLRGGSSGLGGLSGLGGSSGLSGLGGSSGLGGLSGLRGGSGSSGLSGLGGLSRSGGSGLSGLGGSGLSGLGGSGLSGLGGSGSSGLGSLGGLSGGSGSSGASTPAASAPAGGHDMDAHAHGARDLVTRQAHGHAGVVHISDSSTCIDFGDIKSGDRMHIEAFYDSVKYPLMEHNGEKEKLMGIMRVYIGS